MQHLPLGWHYKSGKNIITARTMKPFVQSKIPMSNVADRSMRTFAYLTKHGQHQPMNFEHLLDKVNRGWLDWNSVVLFDSCPLNSIDPWPNYSRLSKKRNLLLQTSLKRGMVNYTQNLINTKQKLKTSWNCMSLYQQHTVLFSTSMQRFMKIQPQVAL